MDKEELLKEAKRKYPEGTRIKSAYTKHEYTVQPHHSLFIDKDGYVDNGGMGYLYYNNKWAEIIKLPQEKEANYEIF